jgi:predicted nucleic-acid-binding protein
MTAVDTNVLARIITNDDRVQAARAAAFLKRQDRVFIAKTVLLELEWVLRKAYRYSPQQVLTAFQQLLKTDNVELEEEATVARALSWYQQGLDFADSLHLASAGPDQRFVTFDVAFHRTARKLAAGKTAVI